HKTFQIGDTQAEPNLTKLERRELQQDVPAVVAQPAFHESDGRKLNILALHHQISSPLASAIRRYIRMNITLCKALRWSSRKADSTRRAAFRAWPSGSPSCATPRRKASDAAARAQPSKPRFGRLAK